MSQMIEKVKIRRRFGRVTRVELQDKHARTVADLPCTAVEIEWKANEVGVVKLAMHGSRVSLEDNDS